MKVIIFLLLCLLAVPAYAAKDPEEYTECTYEVHQVFKDGVLVSETKVRKCKEEVKNSNKFDPENKFGDYVKKRLVEYGFLALIIHSAK